MPDQIAEILQKKHGIGKPNQTETRCHGCGFKFEELSDDQPHHLFANGITVYFCTTNELIAWKTQYKIL